MGHVTQVYDLQVQPTPVDGPGFLLSPSRKLGFVHNTNIVLALWEEIAWLWDDKVTLGVLQEVPN